MPFCFASCSVIYAATDALKQSQESLSLCMQTPKDRKVTKSLKDAQELLQQSKGVFNPDSLFFAKPGKSPSKLANYIGPINITTVSGAALTAMVRCFHCRHSSMARSCSCSNPDVRLSGAAFSTVELIMSRSFLLTCCCPF